MPCFRFLLAFFLAATAAFAAAPDFEREVAPVLIARCLECHQGKEASGDLRLTHPEELAQSGQLRKRLLERVVAGEMPPEKQGRSQKLPDKEIEILRRWIESDAAWPEGRTLDWFERTSRFRAGRDWWSFQPIQRPAVPRLKHGPQPVNPIDAFIRARLENADMQPAPRADERTLLRRLYYDVIGLPPSRKQFEAPVEWSDAVDELLDSPQYGVRWARYWLDVARYAETSGYERDQEKPFAWRYRDWVVQALNDDLPFDRFIIQQLAGDEIAERNEQSVIATGFLRLGAWNDEPNLPADYVYDRLEDMVHTTSSAFLGLTVKCARCHDHKFDPIRQQDYYRMAATFWSGPIHPRDRKLLGGPSTTELGYTNVLGWTDITTKPRPLHLLKNGERLHPRGEVRPASLSAIPELERKFVQPAEASTTQRRLQLARWIADENNPLTSRVLVNRLWQHHFGEGIVRTPNNFGFLSDPPTHPLLLDWLAAEFLAHGRSLKHVHRLILTSATWQQASLHPEQANYQLRDSGNRLWWRFNRRRLDAEAVRDSMLAVSGELDRTLGGPSFKPTISPEALEGLSRKTKAWKASPPELQNRRSLYMYMKRGLLPPMMTTFDLCDATLSCGQRDVTTVPTQALALLNNAFVHARSEHLARAIMASTATTESRINQAWSRILKRDPSRSERLLAHRHLNVQRDEFARLEPMDTRLALHLRADSAKTGPEGLVEDWPDLSGHRHHASQEDTARRPRLNRDGFGGRPTVEFSQRSFLHLAGPVLDQQHVTFICVVSDHGPPGHREIISNWNRQRNVRTSIFFGLTKENTVRFCDVFNDAGQIPDRGNPFILSAVNGPHLSAVYHDGRMLKSRPGPLYTRKLDTPWVIGQQGNINGEFWQGGIAEIRVYNGALDANERSAIERELAQRYRITLSESVEDQQRTPETLALASLCHVLLNSNEFIFID